MAGQRVDVVVGENAAVDIAVAVDIAAAEGIAVAAGTVVADGIAVAESVGVTVEGGRGVIVGVSSCFGARVLLGRDVGVAAGACSVGAAGRVSGGRIASAKIRATARNIKTAAAKPRTCDPWNCARFISSSPSRQSTSRRFLTQSRSNVGSIGPSLAQKTLWKRTCGRPGAIRAASPRSAIHAAGGRVMNWPRKRSPSPITQSPFVGAGFGSLLPERS